MNLKRVAIKTQVPIIPNIFAIAKLKLWISKIWCQFTLVAVVPMSKPVQGIINKLAGTAGKLLAV